MTTMRRVANDVTDSSVHTGASSLLALAAVGLAALAGCGGVGPDEGDDPIGVPDEEWPNEAPQLKPWDPPLDPPPPGEGGGDTGGGGSIPAQADLASLWTDHTCDPGPSVEVFVANHGGANAPPFVTRFTFQTEYGPVHHEVGDPGLQAVGGRFTSAPRPWGCTEYLCSGFQVTVDVYGTVAEANEGNNVHVFNLSNCL